jgi:TDG/mug DNA glycosylase family protein
MERGAGRPGVQRGHTPILPDVLRPGLRLVIIGSAAGAVSAARGAYYAGPGNRFWPILAETRLTDRLLLPEEFTRLPDYGIGLTDLAKHASGADAALPPGAYDAAALAAKLRACRPKLIAFNGATPAKAFLAAGLTAGLPPIHLLPSTSGAARRWWDPAPWHALAALVRAA